MLGQRLGQLTGGEHGEQVRQVRRTRHGQVVLHRREAHRLGAAQLGERLDQVDRPGEECTCGVIAQGRPSNSAAVAASGPERSLPAIGWLPT